MLGATITGASMFPVSIPPRQAEFLDHGKKDWKTGVELVRTCVDTYDTKTYVHHLSVPFVNGYTDHENHVGDSRPKLCISVSLQMV